MQELVQTYTHTYIYIFNVCFFFGHKQKLETVYWLQQKILKM